jgi:hypothetical protein
MEDNHVVLELESELNKQESIRCGETTEEFKAENITRKNKTRSYGFILTRHVNSELTNKYWNECIMCIRKLYPYVKIIVIDDNSNKDFVKAFHDYKNVEYVESEFPQRGELLPYYYFHKNRYFKNAIIIHDSVFIQKRVPFEIFKKINVLPLWYFSNDITKSENIQNSFRLLNTLKNNEQLKIGFNKLENRYETMVFRSKNWNGCFGCQSYINYYFLNAIQQKYNLFNLLNHVKNRTDRCSLERIIGIIFYYENSIQLNSVGSLFGNIFAEKNTFNYDYDKYINDKNNNKKNLTEFVKIWTGR